MVTEPGDALFQEYAEVAQDFRTLTDIRFRLLGYLPVVSGASVALAVYKGDVANVPTIGLALFGLVSTLGVCTYNARNDQLYDELVSRAADIERRVGIPDGHFATRPRAWLQFQHHKTNWKVEHGWSLSLIYGASIALWISLLFASIFELTRCAYIIVGLPFLIVETPTLWVNTSAIVAAILLTVWGMKIIAESRKQLADTQRERVFATYQHALTLYRTSDFSDKELIERCASINSLRATLKPPTVPNSKRLERAKVVVEARCSYLIRADSKTRESFVPMVSDREWASHLIGFLTDLPPRWIADSGQDRRGALADARWRAENDPKRRAPPASQGHA